MASASLVSWRQTTSGSMSASQASTRGMRAFSELTFQVAKRTRANLAPGPSARRGAGLAAVAVRLRQAWRLRPVADRGTGRPLSSGPGDELCDTPCVHLFVCELAELEAALAGVCGELNAAHARLVSIVGEALDSDAWHGWGIHSPAQWVAWQTGLSPDRATEIVRIASRRAELPVTLAAFEAGAVDRRPGHRPRTAGTRRATRHRPASWRSRPRSPNCVGSSPRTRSRTRSRRKTPPAEPPTTQQRSAARSTSTTRAASICHAVGDVVGGATVEAALHQAKDTLYRAGERDASWWDALVEVAERSLANPDDQIRRDRFRVHLHVDITDPAATVARLTNGVGIPAWARDLLLCDATVQPVWVRDNVPIGVGRTSRADPRPAAPPGAAPRPRSLPGARLRPDAGRHPSHRPLGPRRSHRDVEPPEPVPPPPPPPPPGTARHERQRRPSRHPRVHRRHRSTAARLRPSGAAVGAFRARHRLPASIRRTAQPALGHARPTARVAPGAGKQTGDRSRRRLLHGDERQAGPCRRDTDVDSVRSRVASARGGEAASPAPRRRCGGDLLLRSTSANGGVRQAGVLAFRLPLALLAGSGSGTAASAAAFLLPRFVVALAGAFAGSATLVLAPGRFLARVALAGGTSARSGARRHLGRRGRLGRTPLGRRRRSRCLAATGRPGGLGFGGREVGGWLLGRCPLARGLLGRLRLGRSNLECCRLLARPLPRPRRRLGRLAGGHQHHARGLEAGHGDVDASAGRAEAHDHERALLAEGDDVAGATGRRVAEVAQRQIALHRPRRRVGAVGGVRLDRRLDERPDRVPLDEVEERQQLVDRRLLGARGCLGLLGRCRRVVRGARSATIGRGGRRAQPPWRPAWTAVATWARASAGTRPCSAGTAPPSSPCPSWTPGSPAGSRAPGPATRATKTHPTLGTGLPPISRPSSNSQGNSAWNSWNESFDRMVALALLAIVRTNASPRPMAPAGGDTSSLFSTAASNSGTSRWSMRWPNVASTTTVMMSCGCSSRKAITASLSWRRLGMARPSVAMFEPSTTTCLGIAGSVKHPAMPKCGMAGSGTYDPPA